MTTSNFGLPMPALPVLPGHAPRVNVHVDKAEEHARTWMDHHGLAGTAAQRRKIHASVIGKAMAWNFPDADLDSLLLATEIFAWCLAFDDTRAETTTVEGFSRFLGVLPALVGVFDRTVTTAEPGFVGALDEVIRHCSAWPPPQLDRLIAAMRATQLGLVWESHVLSTNRWPSVADYLIMRPHYFCSHVLIALAEPVGRYSLPPNARHDPDIRRLETMVANVIAWHNDLISFRMETHDPARARWIPLSLPALLVKRDGCDYTAAFTSVISMCDEEAGRAGRLIAQCAASPDPSVRKHAGAMATMINGCYVWHSDIATGRYLGESS